MAKFLMVLGLLGVIAGFCIVGGTALGQINKDDPTHGYLFGVILIVFGALRFMRNLNK